MTEDYTKRASKGWIPAPKDPRDYKAPVYGASNYPVRKDFFGQTGGVMDQGQSNSCVAFALAAQTYTRRKLAGQNDILSRKGIYWNTRAAQGTAPADNGSNIQVACSELVNKGSWLGDFSVWTSENYVNNVQTAPTAAQLNVGLTHKGDWYAAVDQTVEGMKAVLQYSPFVVGVQLQESFYYLNRQNSLVRMPDPNKPFVVSHAVTVIGYDDVYKVFYCQNSWGIGWGYDGNFSIKYDYLLDPSLSGNGFYVNNTR